MSKVEMVQCDVCGKQGCAKNYGMLSFGVPEGWFQVTGFGFNLGADICSAECLKQYANRQAPKE